MAPLTFPAVNLWSNTSCKCLDDTVCTRGRSLTTFNKFCPLLTYTSDICEGIPVIRETIYIFTSSSQRSLWTTPKNKQLENSRMNISIGFFLIGLAICFILDLMNSLDIMYYLLYLNNLFFFNLCLFSFLFYNSSSSFSGNYCGRECRTAN